MALFKFVFWDWFFSMSSVLLPLKCFFASFMLIDAHSHLHFSKDFSDYEAVILRAGRAGVKGQILVGCDIKDSLNALAFAKRNASFYKEKGDGKFWCAIGIHPHDAVHLTDQVLKDFEKLIKKENGRIKLIVAIGEIGLDYFRNLQAEDIQKNAFTEQLKLAKKLDLPVVIHQRDAWEDTIGILNKVGNKRVVLHSFTGGIEEARECIQRGYYISFSGMLTYPKNDHLSNVARMVPRDKFMVETDCPYLPPQMYRGQRNEPAFVVETAKEFARVNEMDLEEVSKLSTANVEAFFGVKFV